MASLGVPRTVGLGNRRWASGCYLDNFVIDTGRIAHLYFDGSGRGVTHPGAYEWTQLCPGDDRK